MNRQRNAAAIIYENGEETEDHQECSAFDIFPNKCDDSQIEYSNSKIIKCNNNNSLDLVEEKPLNIVANGSQIQSIKYSDCFERYRM